MTPSGPSVARLLRRPEFIVAIYAACLQAVVLAPLRGPFNYADELGYVAAARYFGPGYPDVQLQAGFLHAGYGIVLSPLTALFTEPSGFHRAATTLNGLLVLGAAVGASRLLGRLYRLNWSSTVAVGVLFASSTATIVYSGVLWAETLLIAMVVLLAWLAATPALTGPRLAAISALAVAFYAVHPRTIVMVVAVAAGVVVDGRRRGRMARALTAVVAIVAGVVAVRLMHGLVADRLYAGSAVELGTNTSVELRLRRIAEGPASWLGGVIGAAWYQLAASFGLALVATMQWFRHGRQWLRSDSVPSQDHVGEYHRADEGLERSGFIIGLSVLLGWAVAGTIAGGTAVRVDQTVYGRYLDHLGPLALAWGAAALVAAGGAVYRRIWLAGVVGVPLIGAVITLWWGASAFDGTGPYAPINAPFFAAAVDLVGSQVPALVGIVIGGVGAGLWWAGRRRPMVSCALTVSVLTFLGVQASFGHVRVHSRDTINLRAMADAVEDLGVEPVMLAEPFAFINLYGGQFWADDVQFVLGSECPVQPYEAIIAPIDDARFLDHRVLFTDPKSERQLLEPPAIAAPDPADAAVRIDGVPDAATSGDTIRVSVEIVNTGSTPLPVMSGGVRPFSVGYRFVGENESRYNTRPVAVDTGAFTLAPGERRRFDVDVVVGRGDEALPPGRYELVADVYVDGLGWVNEAGCPGGLPEGASITVLAATAG